MKAFPLCLLGFLPPLVRQNFLFDYSAQHTIIPTSTPSSPPAHHHPHQHTIIPTSTPSSPPAHHHPHQHTIIPTSTPSSPPAHHHPHQHTSPTPAHHHPHQHTIIHTEARYPHLSNTQLLGTFLCTPTPSCNAH